MNNSLLKNNIQQFFDRPAVQGGIMLVILISTSSVVTELFYPNLFHRYAFIFHIIEYSALAIFTFEYGLRLWAAPQRKKFMAQPFNIIDLLAILPSYIELILAATPWASLLRSVRLLRILRFSRVLRAFKLFRYQSFFKTIFQYQDTILQSITPVLLGFGVCKSIIIFLEYHHWWLRDANLDELFAIIGFALGIILSQKIGTAHNKFTQVEEVTVRITSTLSTLQSIAPSDCYSRWAQHFLEQLTNHNPQARAALQQENLAILTIIKQLEPQPAELTILYKDLLCDSHFCLSKSQRLTPAAYDTLLHQATIVYLALIAAFIPGITGIISVLIASYILYGMYRVTQDLDSISGGEYKLINIDLTELRQLANSYTSYEKNI